MEGKKVLTIAEIAKLLGVCPALVYRGVKSGSIPALKVGDRWLVPTSLFEKYLSGEFNPPTK